MGGSTYSDDVYKARATHRSATGTPMFKHTADIDSGRVAAGTHPNLDPKGKIRESRDSDVHPESLPIIIGLDVTGSMRDQPRLIQAKLPSLMNTIMRKAGVEHPQIMMMAIGDATSDRAPLQVGQFESGLEMEDDLGRFFLEGQGGGQDTESYELAIYFAARRTVTDAWEKRGKKGYMFIIGDERPYPNVMRRFTDSLLGVPEQADIPVAEMVREAQERWEIFYILPKGASHGGSKTMLSCWRDLLGQNVIELDSPEAICEVIGLAIGVNEGTIDLTADPSTLVDDKSDPNAVASATKALVAYSTSRGNTAVATVEGDRTL